ncbi:hypothetical protein L3X38_041184 [Prunus dulcis]|uniref:Uncharacterized protein n=1 Tax=Prunus dulcis TaxID=3755 RepID=A0AAD4UTX0_PRUDU|nr:hypothetical protein L3X38_041184 [Prunus dulcis]
MDMFSLAKKEFGQDDSTLFSCEALMKKGFWGLCYDQYETSLFSWSKGVDNGEIKDDKKVNMKDNKRCSTEFWRRTIRDILITISYIHVANLYRGASDSASSYVFFNGELTLIKVEYSLDDDVVKDKDSRMMQDFQDFKKILVVLLKPNEY